VLVLFLHEVPMRETFAEEATVVEGEAAEPRSQEPAAAS
jgi:hypothetical protein